MADDEEQRRPPTSGNGVSGIADENVFFELKPNSSPSLDHTPTKTTSIPAAAVANLNENNPSASAAYWSPRYEFDAPRFINFAKPKYDETRCLLNKIVLQTEEPSKAAPSPRQSRIEARTPGETLLASCAANESVASDSEDNEDFLAFLMQSQLEAGDTSDLEGDVWFLRFHPLHEPLRPQTPPGPLITPEKPLPIDGSRTCRSLANILAMSPSSPSRSSGALAPLSHSHPHSPVRSNPGSPGKSSPRMIRSPAAFTVARGHVSASSNAGSSFSSSTRGSPSIGPSASGPKSPVRVLGLKARPARILRPNEPGNGRPPALGIDCAALNSSPSAPLPKSPLKQSYTSSAMKRSTSHPETEPKIEGRASVGDLEQRLDTHLMIRSRRDSPETATRKRIKQETAHSRITQLASMTRKPSELQLGTTLPSNTDTINPTAPTRTSRRTNNTDLDDIKKLLSQHNSRLKPKR